MVLYHLNASPHSYRYTAAGRNLSENVLLINLLLDAFVPSAVHQHS